MTCRKSPIINFTTILGAIFSTAYLPYAYSGVGVSKAKLEKKGPTQSEIHCVTHSSQTAQMEIDFVADEIMSEAECIRDRDFIGLRAFRSLAVRSQKDFLAGFHNWIETDQPPISSWDETLASLAISDRKAVTLKLLKKKNNGSSVCDLTNPVFQFIFQDLTPIEGVNEAVQEFWTDTCSAYLDSNGQLYKYSEMVFNNQSKFIKFFGFPEELFSDEKEENFSANFYKEPLRRLYGQPLKLLPYFSSKSNLTVQQFQKALRQSANSNSTRRMLGKVVGSYLVTKASEVPIWLTKSRVFVDNEFSKNRTRLPLASDPLTQTRGAIVQGIHAKHGHWFGEIGGNMGAGANVETDIDDLNQNLGSYELEGWYLSRLPVLEARLLVQSWSYSNDLNLIRRIRENAILLDPSDVSVKYPIEGFGPLRVKIHSFPNIQILNELKNLVSLRKQSLTKEQVEITNELIKDIEKFCEVNAQATSLDFKKLHIPDTIQEQVGKLQASSKEPGRIEKLNQIRIILSNFSMKNDNEMIKIRRSDSLLFKNLLLEDRKLLNSILGIGAESIHNLSKVTDLSSYNHFIELFQELLHSVQVDGMIAEEEFKRISNEVHLISGDKNIDLKNRVQLIRELLRGTVDSIAAKVQSEYGQVDEKISHIRDDAKQVMPNAVDEILRTHSVFLLSQLYDHVAPGADVINPGITEGVLRLNPNPNEVDSDDIPIFSEIPAKCYPVAGILTLNSGNRLSHLQLLATSLQIPNAKINDKQYSEIKQYEGKRVRLEASADGRLKVTPLTESDVGSSVAPSNSNSQSIIQNQKLNLTLNRPLSFQEAFELEKTNSSGSFAGTKGMNLVRLRADQKLKEYVPDGFIIPYGVYDSYLKEAGLHDYLEQLQNTPISKKSYAILLTQRIKNWIETHPLPATVLDPVMDQLVALAKRTGHKKGYFFRSDTNLEDLPEFNAAGLNETVPNVPPNREKVDLAIRKVWASAFNERATLWRTFGLHSKNVILAYPSLVVMPTIEAESSGVILTHGLNSTTGKWQAGHGVINAGLGIGSVVESRGRDVATISMVSGTPHWTSFSAAKNMAIENATGGLKQEHAPSNSEVITSDQALKLNSLALESAVSVYGNGSDSSDVPVCNVEWAIDYAKKPYILQLRTLPKYSTPETSD